MLASKNAGMRRTFLQFMSSPWVDSIAHAGRGYPPKGRGFSRQWALGLGGRQAQQAGGARVDGDGESLTAGVSGCNSATCASTFCAKIAVVRGWGCAHCAVVRARQQSWLQHPRARTEGCEESTNAESWQWCAMRRQQARGGAAVA